MSASDWLPPRPPTPALEPAVPAPRPQPGWRRLLAPVGGGAVVLVKLASQLKLLTTSASMLVSIAAYSLLWGWRFAIGFVLLLLVHELGHVIQLRREGIRASAPLFVPFLGAVIGARSLGDDALAEARVGLAGPVLGTLGAAALVPVAILTDSDLLRALAFTGFFLNLFNLAPVVPLDGGRAMAAMAPWMWFVGLAALAGAAVAFRSPIMVVILVLGAMETWRRWRGRRTGGAAARDYYRVPARSRLAVTAVYVGLIVVLAAGMDATHLVRI